MIDTSKIPSKGIVYALYKDKVVFKKYASVDQVNTSEEDLLEFHCFDAKKEYRYIDRKELVITDERYEYSYEEEKIVTLYKKDGTLDSIDQRDQLENRLKVTVVNYIDYDENDLLRIINYRLKEVE